MTGGSNYLSLHEVELSGNNRCQQIEINSFPDSLLFISTGFLPRVSSKLLIRNMIATKTTGPDQPKNVWRCTSEPRSCYKVPLSSMYSKRLKSRSELQVHQMRWMGARKMFWNLKCSPVSEKKLLDL